MTGPESQPRAGDHSDANWMVALGYLLLIGSVLGVSTSLAKLAAKNGAEPLEFLGWSVIGATLLLGAVAAARRDAPPRSAGAIRYYLVSGFFSLAAPNYIYFAAAPNVGAGYVALSLAFPPLYTYLGAIVLGADRPNFARVFGVASALCGAAVLAIHKLNEPAASAGWVLATLSAPLLLAVGNLYRALRWPVGATPAQLVLGMLAMTSLALFGVACVPALIEGSTVLDSTAIALVAAQAFCFALFYLLFFVLMELAGPVYVSLTGSVGAVVGVGAALVFLGESVPGGFVIGACLIALGVGLVTRGAAKR